MRHVILLPDLGQTTSEAKVLQWWKQPGEKVVRGEPLLAVETDKVDMDVESFVDGYLRQALVDSGAVATALQPVAILTDTPDEIYEAISDTIPQRTKATPAAKSLARELGVDLSGILPARPDGLIVRKDLERSADRRYPDFRAVTAMAAVAAAGKRDIPHFYASIDVDAAPAAEWRENWNARHPELRASFNDIFVRCASQALRDTPGLNIRFHGGKYQRRATADIVVVMAREPGLALVEISDPQAAAWVDFLPIMRAAVTGGGRQGVRQGDGPLLAISNLGMHGVKEFAAIIPPGCTAALAIGAVRLAPVIRNGRLEAGSICTLTLSADHRIVDGVTAALFLGSMRRHLESL
jgi:pyruvate dehydrogenase E2 component (dihydrolipoamide acetyltransferase)